MLQTDFRYRIEAAPTTQKTLLLLPELLCYVAMSCNIRPHRTQLPLLRVGTCLPSRYLAMLWANPSQYIYLFNDAVMPKRHYSLTIRHKRVAPWCIVLLEKVAVAELWLWRRIVWYKFTQPHRAEVKWSCRLAFRTCLARLTAATPTVFPEVPTVFLSPSRQVPG
jgi:hypothetical protein